MALTGPEILLYEKKGSIAYVTLNRPERLNALTPEMFERLDDAWERFRDDPDATAAILSGSGRAFCAGMDLKDQAERMARDPSLDLVKLIGGAGGIAGTPQAKNVQKPVIAAVNGYAVAGGFQLLIHCDLRVASTDAYFGITEARVGRGSPWAVPLLWQMPLAIILEMIFKGDMVPAQRLYEVGFLNAVVPSDNLLQTASEIAQKISENAPLTVRAAKESLHRAMNLGCEAGLEEALQIYEKVYSSEDAVEGPRAFAEKRKPQWKGR